MDIRRFAIGDKVSSIQLGLLSTVFLTGFVGVTILPFYIYLFGAGILWEIFGIMVCMIIVWNTESYRLYRYSKKHTDIISLPGYLSKRMGDRREYLRAFLACEIIILTMVIVALVLKIAGHMASVMFGIPSTIASFILVMVIATYVGLFGFDALAKTAWIKATILFITTGAIGVYLFSSMGIRQMVRNMMATNITGSVSEYINVLYHDGRVLEVGDYISLLSIGMLATGLPTLLTTFFSAERPRRINTSKRIMLVYTVVLFIASSVMGVVSRGYLYQFPVTSSLSEYYQMFYNTLISDGTIGKLLGGLLIASLVVAVASLIECCFKEVTTSVYEDIIVKGRIIRLRKKNERTALAVITLATGFVVYIVSECIRTTSIDMVFTFIGTIGCSISPTIFLSLFWKRMNKFGALAGLVTGLVCVPVFKFALLFDVSGAKASFCDMLGVNSFLPAIICSVCMIVLVSLITPKPSEEIVNEFMDVRNRLV